MKRIIAKHFNKINKILLNSDYYIDKAKKISKYLKRKIKKKGKFLFVEMVVLLLMHHILLVN